MNERNSQAGAQQAVGQTTQNVVSDVGLPPEALVHKQLLHVGAAYAVIFALLFFYAWRLTSATRRLSDRVDELERDSRDRH